MVRLSNHHDEALSRQGRGKAIREINLNPLPLDGGRARVGVKFKGFDFLVRFC
jgi:hypothetical protein